MTVFLFSLCLCYLTAFWPPWFLMKSQRLIHESLLYMRSYFLATLKIFFLCLSFDNSTMICVDVKSNWSLLFLGCREKCFSSHLGIFQPLFLQIFFQSSSVSPLFETAIVCMFLVLMVSHRAPTH